MRGRDVIWKQPGMTQWKLIGKYVEQTNLGVTPHLLTHDLMAGILHKLIGRLFHCRGFIHPTY